MRYLKIPTKQVASIVRAAAKNYRKRTVSVVPTESVTLHDLNWSGGTRSEYATVEIATLRRIGDLSRYHMMAPWNNPAEGATLPIVPGVIVVRTGFFCGKESEATLYVHPADMPKTLPGA